MIELTSQQIDAIESHAFDYPRVVNPRTHQTFVLLPVEEYDRLADDDYDGSPWTAEEHLALAWEAGRGIGWESMDEYDQLPEEPCEGVK